VTEVVGRRGGVFVAFFVLAALLPAACGSSSTAPPSSSTTPQGTNTSWIKDSVNSLNVFLPDADSIYWFDGYGTDHGARTVISGQSPQARYWSFTAYPVPQNADRQHVHDTQIEQSGGRYTVTIAQSCANLSGTCLRMGNTDGGVIVFRLYVPIDVATTGTSAVPLPTISYENSSGHSLTLTQAAGSSVVADAMQAYRNQHGALPPELRRSYPPAAPVPTPITDPPPVGRLSYGDGPYANPDNAYEHIRLDTARGNLVVTAKAPTYLADSFPKANGLSRAAPQNPQVRYWSLCIVMKGRHTGDCLRDSQVVIPSDTGAFTVVVSPTCPVAGYANCIVSGPRALQSSISYRNLLPSAAFKPDALMGPYRMTATYVARTG
jgi:hypothetical protein